MPLADWPRPAFGPTAWRVHYIFADVFRKRAEEAAMPASVRGQVFAVRAAIFAALILVSAGIQANRLPAADAKSVPAHRIVVRFSNRMLSSLFDKRIDRQAPVRDVILGTPVSGVSRIVADPQWSLVPSADSGRFTVSFTGTIYSRTVGRQGPAIIYGHAITWFTASSQVVFEPGRGFHGSTPQISARTQCHTDGIGSTRGGLIGCIIRRRAGDEVSARHAEITAVSRQHATGRISAAFEKYMAERLTRLNRMMEIRDSLAELRPEPRPQTLVLSTTPDYLEIAEAGDHGDEPIVLPTWSAASDAEAPVEVWLHQSIAPQAIVDVLQRIFAKPKQNALVDLLAGLPADLGKEAARAIIAFATEDSFDLQSVGDWLVVEIRPPPANIARQPSVLRR
jgi:hypothetical protein